MDKLSDFNTKKYNYGYKDVEIDEKTRIILDFIKDGKNVLDVGCFNGYLMNILIKMNNKVVGVDNSESAFRICKEKGLKCILHNIEEDLPFKQKTFDVVVASEIIEHIYDTDKLVKEMKRVLKDDGFIIITTPNLAALSRRIRLLFGISPQIDIGVINEQGDDLSVGHIRYFTVPTLEKLLKRNGLTIENRLSDYISLNKLRFKRLAKFWPSLGTDIIIKARRESI